MADNEERASLLGVGIWATFIYYFSCTTMIGAIATSQGLGLSLATPQPYRYGVILGLIAGVLGSYFNRTSSMTVGFEEQQAFSAQLNQALADMGFELQPAAPSDLGPDYLIYQRAAMGRWLSGQIFVQLSQHSATIASRSIHIKQLRQKIQT